MPQMTRDPLATPERVAFAGDWHMNQSWAQDAVEYAAGNHADVIIHCGDFGYLFRPEFLSTLTDALELADMTLLFVDGNHEDHKWLARQPLNERGLRPLTDRVFHLPRGFRWTWDGVRFLALGGAHSVDGIWRRERGDLWQREERLTDDDVARAVAGGQADVMVCHDCPDGITIPGVKDQEPNFPMIEILRAQEHREILRRVVNRVKPRMFWHGHYHVAYSELVNLGWGAVTFVGLDRDATLMEFNIDVVDMPTIKALAQVRA